MKRIARHIILIIISISFIFKTGIAQKTDTIIHINGNVMTGELKKLVYGVATWKMDGMGTISLEEVKINTIQSSKIFEIKMKNDLLYYGSLDTSGMDRKVNILGSHGKALVNIEEIVEIYPIRRNFWMRSSGNFSLGANFSKGSNVGTVVFSGNLDYRKRKSYFNLSWDDNNTFQGDSLSSSKADLTLAWERTLQKKWSTQVALTGSQNSELGTKLRLGVNILGIKDILYNNWNRFYAGAGLSVSQETPYDDSGVTNDLAGLFRVAWKVYKYTIPKVWVDTDISFLPYITDWGRYRAVFNLNPKISIINDNFKIGFKFYYNYDSKPPTDASSNNDYGLNLELTYSFH